MVNRMSATASIAERDVALMQTETRLFGRARLTRSVIAKAFRTAVLLTGAVRQAEAVVLEAIRRMDPEQVSDDTFLLDCVQASVIPCRQCEPTPAETAKASSILAPELKRILLLSPHLRQALVLRVLLGFSDNDCERFHIRDAGQRACRAAKELARIRAAERSAAA
jgi:hypothetical protein